jgi:TRAP-type C4-dicarboxylate transport system permease small subunit
MKLLVRVSDGLSRLFGVVSMLLLAAATAVVTQMVFMRYVLRESTVWQTEFVIYALVGATFFGAPYVLLHKGHVGVDLLPEMLGGAAAKGLRLVAGIVSIAFCAAVAWSSWTYFYEAASKGWTTETVSAIPLWIPLLPLPLGMGMLCLQGVAELVKLFRPEVAA